MNKKILMVVFSLLLVTIFVSAGTTWGTYKQNNCVNIGTICPLDNCNETVLTILSNPDSTIALSNVSATHNGDNWNYSFCDTIQTGTYTVYGYSTNSTDTEKFIGDFEITPSGNTGSANIVFFIVVIALLYTINLLGFFNRNAPLTLLGGMALIFLGIYLINNGIIIYRDNLTNYIAYITLGWGFISAIWATVEELM